MVREGIFKEQPEVGIKYNKITRYIAAANDCTSDGMLGIPYEGKDFKYWRYETKMYLYHKPSMTALEWWSQPDPEDIVKCNKLLSTDEIMYLMQLFVDEIKESGI